MTLNRRKMLLAASTCFAAPYIITKRASAQGAGKQAFALHIGLNTVGPNYPSSVKPLAGCIKDAQTYQAISSSKGFKQTPRPLFDKAATVQEVKRHIYGAAQKLKSGDLFLVTYAGHGGQVTDTNGDEPDRKDETWCLYDRQLRDDELYAMWAQFDAGVRIVVISDSCHSGTVTREIEERKNMAREVEDSNSVAARLFTSPAAGGARSRNGVSVPDLIRERSTTNASSRGGPVDSSVPVPRTITEAEADAEFATNRSEYARSETQAGDTSGSVRATGVLLAGCQDTQLSWERNGQGMFTSQLNDVLSAATDLQNYSSFLAAINRRMPANQTPNFFPFGTPGDEFYLTEAPFKV